MRVLIAGVGNIFLSDDGFGPAVAARLAHQTLPTGVRAEDFGIRGLHLAYELLDGYDGLILVDAAPRGETPGTVSVIEPDLDAAAGGAPSVDAHGMSPDAVFALLRTLGGTVGQAWVVACEPASVAEGIGLSPPVAAAVEGAARLAVELAGEVMTEATVDSERT